jgi:hypothetical protein
MTMEGPKMVIAPHTLQSAFELLKLNRTNLFHVGEAELEGKKILESKEVEILNTMDAKELGPNDKAREARIKSMLEVERKAVEGLSKKVREAKLAQELAEMSVDLLKWEIRQKESEKQ